ncbi:MAG: biopolymer transporter ExbD [Pseudomonadota bacterium]|nr:biopolymer transporter ExbD [Pseudomonadota bacterium]
MRRSFTMRKLARRHRKPSELLLVPMIDIFTVLVTFLLMTAVFSRTVIMELKLPAPGTDSAEPQKGLVLEVELRKSGLTVQDRSGGVLKRLPRADAGAPYDLAGLSAYLQTVKAQFPQVTEATLLLEGDISYDHLVQVMDTVRIIEHRVDGQLVQSELFPDVSLGDAEVLAGAR